MRKIICLCMFITLFTVNVYASEDLPVIEVNDEPVEETVDTPEFLESYDWEDLSFKSVTPITLYLPKDMTLNIFPCYLSDKHISIRKIVLSGQQFWATIFDGHKGTCPNDTTKLYSYFTDSDGTSYAFIKISSTSGYFVETVGLPSGYLRAILDHTKLKGKK